MRWAKAIRHVARETADGFRGGLADVLRVYRATTPPMSRDAERFLIDHGGFGPRASAEMVAHLGDPFWNARVVRLLQLASRAQEDATLDWFETTVQHAPGIADLALIGDRDLDEFHEWMLTPHPALSEHLDVTPIGWFGEHPADVERLWREYLERTL